MEQSPLDYDIGYREGVFDKCNGKPAFYDRAEVDTDVLTGAYFDGYDGHSVVMEQPLARVVMEETPLVPLYLSYPEDDLIEGIFDAKGNLLGAWSPNDANWRSEYFAPLMEKLGFEIFDAGEEYDDKLREHAMELWGLTAEEVGFTTEE